MNPFVKLFQHDPVLFHLAVLALKLAGTVVDLHVLSVELVAAEYEDGEKLAGPGDWHYELAKLIRENNKAKLIEILEVPHGG